jgi:hypothetical protein
VLKLFTTYGHGTALRVTAIKTHQLWPEKDMYVESLFCMEKQDHAQLPLPCDK